MSYQDALAFALHEELCDAAPDCPRLRPDSAHADYYEMRAQHLIGDMAPLIGVANVLPVVRIMLRELDLLCTSPLP